MTDPGALRRAAAGIGELLVREAFHHQDRCSWTGAGTDEGPGGSVVRMQRALGGDLYDGTSGVALFLAELFAGTGDPSFRHTALAAARHAAGAMSRPDAPVGLYDGVIGTAVALSRVDVLLEEPSVIGGLLPRVAAIAVPGPAAHESDIISGGAGAVLGLLTLAAAHDREDLTERAVTFGRTLLAAADRRGGTLSWRLPGRRPGRNLAGYSHGASGVAAALIELHALAGAPRWADAAVAAFAYEATVFDPERANWPDLRGARRFGALSAPDARVTRFWCHGAPGIALARIRATDVLGPGPWEQEAKVALLTTGRDLGPAVRGRQLLPVSRRRRERGDPAARVGVVRRGHRRCQGRGRLGSTAVRRVSGRVAVRRAARPHAGAADRTGGHRSVPAPDGGPDNPVGAALLALDLGAGAAGGLTRPTARCSPVLRPQSLRVR